MLKRRSIPSLLAAIAACAAATTAIAGYDVTLEPVARGAYSVKTVNGEEFSLVQPYNSEFINVYITGAEIATGQLVNHRGLFVYDLPKAPRGQVAINAALRVFVPSSLGVVNGPHEITIHGVDATIAELEASAASFADLGAGDPLAGPVTLVSDDQGEFVDFSLNESGLAALNAALGGKWALSSRSDREDEFDIDRYCFGQSGTLGNISDGNSQLLITWGTPPDLGLAFEIARISDNEAVLTGKGIVGTTDDLVFDSLRLDAAVVSGASTGPTSGDFEIGDFVLENYLQIGGTVSFPDADGTFLEFDSPTGSETILGLNFAPVGTTGTITATFVGSGKGEVVVVGTWTIVEPPPPACKADLNGDGVVDGADLGLLLADWGPCAPGKPAE